MAQDRRGARDEDADWIFAIADPGTLPTENLPGREEFERYSAPLLGREESDTADDREPDAVTGPLPEVEGAWRSEPGHGERDLVPEPDEETPPAPHDPTYARSGTTPNAEETPWRRHQIPARFADLGAFDALRDVGALVCLLASLSTTFTVSSVLGLELIGRIAVGIALIVLVAVHLLRWLPQKPPLRAIRRLRVFGLAPGLFVALATLLTDLALSLPVLFSPLPDGPPVGVGAGVSLLLVGVILGIEPRAHEGYLPGDVARRRSRALILAIAGSAAVAFTVALVMIIGRAFTTGWAYSLLTFASAGVSALLLVIVIGTALRRERSWFVFSTAAVAGLVIVALADNSLRLEFAAPASFATAFVYLPFLFAAWGVMISRSFVRTMPLTFQRADWIVYTLRAFEFSAVMHIAAVIWQVLAALAALGGAGRGGPVLHLMDAVVAACFVVLSLFARRSLIERPAGIARSSAVVAGVVMLVVGFLDVIVNSLAIGAGAGLVTGGVALAIGLGTALMLTVPAPVRDEYGAPDLVQMFDDFRRRDSSGRALASQVPDISAERARKKVFPT